MSCNHKGDFLINYYAENTQNPEAYLGVFRCDKCGKNFPKDFYPPFLKSTNEREKIRRKAVKLYEKENL